MNWRDHLPTSKSDVQAKNTQNTQKHPKSGVFVDFMNSVYGLPNLNRCLNEVTVGLEVTPSELMEKLSTSDIEDWEHGRLTPETLRAFAKSVSFHRQMRRGVIPNHFTQHATCAKCGPIWYWLNIHVSGCPWCWNRINGHPIPRP